MLNRDIFINTATARERKDERRRGTRPIHDTASCAACAAAPNKRTGSVLLLLTHRLPKRERSGRRHSTPHACMHTISMWGGRREAPPPLTIAASTLPYLQRNHFCQCRGLVGLCFYSSVLMTILFLFEVKLIKLILR